MEQPSQSTKDMFFPQTWQRCVPSVTIMGWFPPVKILR